MSTPTSPAPALSPRQLFEDTLRPAELLLRVYRLLECDSHQNSGALLQSLRPLVGAGIDEDLLLIANEIFIGVVREKAEIPPNVLKRARLDSLLRQAVVVSCTALETYLPALLQTYLPTVIGARGRAFLPADKELHSYFKNLTFNLDETLRITGNDDAPLYIANKLIGYTKFTYLSGPRGVQTVGLLLALDDPWNQIAGKLARDAATLQKTFKDTTDRRNDIVHRADRSKNDLTGDLQTISYATALQAVDSIRHACLALDELITARISELTTPMPEEENGEE